MLTVIPVPAVTVVGLKKFVPVSVTVELLPAASAVGATAESTGGGGLIVNTAAGLVPAGVLTVTFTGPGAAAGLMSNVALICVLLSTTRFETVIEEPALMVAGALKFVPVRVTLTTAPAMPLAGAIALRVVVVPAACRGLMATMECAVAEPVLGNV